LSAFLITQWGAKCTGFRYCLVKARFTSIFRVELLAGGARWCADPAGAYSCETTEVFIYLGKGLVRFYMCSARRRSMSAKPVLYKTLMRNHAPHLLLVPATAISSLNFDDCRCRALLSPPRTLFLQLKDGSSWPLAPRPSDAHSDALPTAFRVQKNPRTDCRAERPASGRQFERAE